MQKSEFDKFADEYHEIHRKSIRLSGEPTDYFAEYKVKDIRELYNRASVELPANILDFGAGVGVSVPHFLEYFPDASLTCLDVSEKSLEIGRSRFRNLAVFRLFDGEKIPFEDNTFDLVFAACVFHHIPHAAHSGLLEEWFRVTKPSGRVVIFEHNPLNPVTVRVVNSCPFDENAVLIHASALKKALYAAGFKAVNLKYRLFMPGFLRALRPLERYLYRCPLGAQYFIHGIKP